MSQEKKQQVIALGRLGWTLRKIEQTTDVRRETASKIVVIGLSFQPSDFYAAWLFRHALEGRKNVKVWIVNPGNSSPEFKERMKGIFTNGYDDSFTKFAEIDSLMQAIEH